MIDLNTPPGTEVICIETPIVSKGTFADPIKDIPKLHHLYTIKGVFNSGEIEKDKELYVVHLKEVPTVKTILVKTGKICTVGWRSTCFRLVNRFVSEMEKGVSIPSIEDKKTLFSKEDEEQVKKLLKEDDDK